MLKGFHPPYTPKGESSLLEPLPWYFAGRVLSLAYDVNADVAQSYLPDGFGKATGKVYGHVCDWQATTNGWELLDPAYSQYREYLVLIESMHPDTSEVRLFCPLIWVDQDISLVRGLVAGWPKKMASVWVTRTYGVDHIAAAPLKEGTRIGATVAVKDRRLAEVAATLDGGEGRPFGFLAHQSVCLQGSPTLVGTPDRGVQRLLRPAIEQKVVGRLHSGSAQIRYFDSPHDELLPLAPRGPVEACLCDMGFTVTGAYAVE